MRRLFLVLVAASLVAGAAETPKQKLLQMADADLQGWECVNPEHTPLDKMCVRRADGVIAVAGQPLGYIATVATYENYLFHAEWRWPGKAGNSGVLLHITDGPMDRVWPVSFQMQMKNLRVGDMLPMSAAKFATPLTSAPGAKTPQLDRGAPDSEKPAGEWNTCEILCRGDSIEVSVNGIFQNRVSGCVPAAGKIGFQLEGVPFELRNVWIAPLPRAIGASWQTAPPDRPNKL